MVMYSCYEVAEYFTVEGARHIPNDKIWKLATIKDLEMPPNHVPIELEIPKEEKIHTLNLVKHKV